MANYSDFDISFALNPLTGDINILEEEAAVSQSVKNLILTSLYERPFQPQIGSIVNQLLFAPYDKITRTILANTIRDTINKFEPRVELKFVDFYEKKGMNGEVLDDHTLYISIGFFVLNRPNLVTLDVVLKRLR